MSQLLRLWTGRMRLATLPQTLLDAVMTTKLDLDRYFDRIGYRGAGVADLATLRTLHELHPVAIPFENLDPLMGRPVDLDIAVLQDKLVGRRRGGFCYEHNLLFWAALEQLGFEVSGLAARVLLNQPADAIMPRTHMALRVEIDGEAWLADVGFGGLTQTGPLRIMTEDEQQTPHETFRLRRLKDDFVVSALAGEDWRTLYRFDLSPQHPIDYRASSYYLSTSPDSHFRTSLICARTAPGQRFALSNNRLSIHRLGSPSQRLVLESAADIEEQLRTTFLIDIPSPADFRRRLIELGIVEN